MKTLARIRYFTMNSWNLSKAPAYNLKVYKVIDKNLQDKVYELMQGENFYEPLDELIFDFDRKYNYKWQAGFNGRSGGYLVLYRGGKNEEGRHFCYPGKNIEDEEVSKEVLKDFRQLAIDIVKETEYIAKHSKLKEEKYSVIKTRKIVV